uniref:2TM domain-containing protein n=1 Tax=uncultured Armatimonadetes bacterium TaxID=157466 RepID=A0A6J4H214_9BACT|nr:hypothetical protein AVDCRST_MAG63-24 [uncultured Armatimonadetes bacterium]
MQKQTYRKDEAEQILTEAVRRAAQAETSSPAGEISHERLLAMAEELGVDAATLEAVLRDQESQREAEKEREVEQQERRDFAAHRRGKFWPQVWSYISVNALLLGINLLTNDWQISWAVWPMLGWGVGLFGQAVNLLPAGGEAFENAFQEWRKAQRRKAKRKAQEQAASDSSTGK